MEIIIVLVIWAAFAVLCAEMARTRNRNTAVWAIMGLLFGVFAVIVLALIGKSDNAANS
jgi:cell division protein FtsW (lipid II flippase)